MKTRKRTARKEDLRDDFDGAWKEVVERYLREFMDFFFPAASAGIDWARGYKFLDKELQRITPKSAVAKGVVDKLFEVYSINGEEWLLAVHLEVQNNPIRNLPERVYEYNYRIYERLKRPVASLVLLTDTQADWRPDKFERETLGCKITLEFPMAKLSDFDTPELAAHANPFSFAVRAHRRAQASSGDSLKRYDLRMALRAECEEEIRRNSNKTNREEVVKYWQGILKFIEWVMQLPEDLEIKFDDEFIAHYGEKAMEFMTYRERIDRNKGREEGRQEGREEGRIEGEIKLLLKVLSARFGEIPKRLNEIILRIDDSNLLEQLAEVAVTCASMDEFEKVVTNS
ncbi:MAG: hypothetical protein ABI977_06035 [Acidobacteriota bacterium]